jgi:hypothetical protein
MTITDLVLITPKGRLGTIEIDVTIEETYTDELQITEHPVQAGASITDHSFKKPSGVVIRCGWSNSSDAAEAGSTQRSFRGGLTKSDYVSGVYSQLLALQQSREPFLIITALRKYNNMLITALNVTRDKMTANILMVTATCREILIADTQSTALPPQENHANPQKTAPVVNCGVKQLLVANPAPGGSLPPSQWSVPSSGLNKVIAPNADTFS